MTALLAGCVAADVPNDDPGSVVGPSDGEAAETEPAPKDDYEREDLVVADFGFGEPTQEHSDPFLTYAVVLDNPNPTAWIAEDVEAVITWTDQSGSVVGRDTGRVFVVLPGQRAAVAGRTFDMDVEQVTDMEIQVRVGSWIDGGEAPFASLEVSDVTLRESAVTGRVTSTYQDELTDLDALAVFRDEAGNIVGGWTHTAPVGFLAGGGQTSVEVRRPTGLEADSADIFVQETWSSFGN